MLALLYIVLAMFFGDRLRRLLLPPAQELYRAISSKERPGIPGWLFDLPAALAMGLPPIMWGTYALAVLVAKIPGLNGLANPLMPANLVAMPLTFILTLAMTGRLRDRAATLRLISREEGTDDDGKPVRTYSMLFRESSGYLLAMLALILFGLWLMRVSLYVDDGQLRAGYSVFSDFGPHTALVSSFARGANFPAQYPHFPLDGIRYHFIFYFLCGNLDYLGLPIDWAINLPSLLGMTAFFSLFGLTAVLLTGRQIAFLASPVLLLLRSSFAFLTFLRDRVRLGDSLVEAIRALAKTSTFIGNTQHENWGLFAVNVYANQRHFLFGMSLLLFLLLLSLPLLKAGLRPLHSETGKRPRFLRWEGWKVPSGGTLLAAMLTIACLPYLHGSVMVALLLILAVLSIFSNGRLQFLLIAATGIGSAILQAWLFSGGASNVADFRIQFGFLADSRTLWEVIAYSAEVFGAAFFLMFIYPWIQPNRFRTVLSVAILVPFVFGFVVSLTPDITVNHKYLMIAAGLAGIFAVDLLFRLWDKPRIHPIARRVDLEDSASGFAASALRGLPALRAKLETSKAGQFAGQFARGHKPLMRSAQVVSRRALVIVLVILLTVTGMVDIAAFARINKNTVAMDLESPVTEWIMAYTQPEAVFLTDTYAFDEFFYSGRKAYYGHAYYAWSAGHDTAGRDAVYRDLLSGSGGNYNAFRELCKEEGISYLLVTDNMRNDTGSVYNDAFFQGNFAVLAHFEQKNNATVYDLR